MKVKENDLLPVLLEELPHLHISPHALGQMWEQQMQQVDRLHALSSSHSQRRTKLPSQVEQCSQMYRVADLNLCALYSLDCMIWWMD